MQKEQKASIVEELTETLSKAGVFYIADTADLDAENISNLRRICFKSDIQLRVVKNTLLKKAFEQVEGRDYSEFYDILTGPTALMISEVGNAPAKVIKSFRKKHDKPILKGAWIEEAIFIGDDQVEDARVLGPEDRNGDT